MNNIALVINTVSKNSDIWDMFFGQIEKHFPISAKKYVFTNDTPKKLPPDCQTVYYNKEETYQEQFSSCIDAVKEEYCIYVSEDYILYDNVRADLIENYCDILDNNQNISFIRFMRGGVVDMGLANYRHYENLFELSNRVPYFYTNQVALWRTKDLKKIHKLGPKLHIANEDWENSFEFQATKVCQDLGIKGLHCYYGEKKRGLYHYDTIVFPHISTALVKGKWNLSEYPTELNDLLELYGMDHTLRGSV
jgi:hypothetical protein